MNKIMTKNLTQSIKTSLGRFLAIMAIIALGVSIFLGLNNTQKTLLATCQAYTQAQEMFDLRVLNDYGWDEAQIQAFSQIPGVQYAEGSVSTDAMVRTDSDSGGMVYKFITIPQQVNRVQLEAGRMPQNDGECLGDSYSMDENDIGSVITISGENTQDTLDSFTVRELTIVGLCSVPTYLNFERGSTTLGRGTLSGYIYVRPQVLDLGAYTEINLTFDRDFDLYSAEYDAYVDIMSTKVEAVAQPLANQRAETLLSDARQALDEGKTEYADGVAEYAKAVMTVYRELLDGKRDLDNARLQLLSAKQEIEDNQKRISDGLSQLDKAQAQIDQGRMTLAEQKTAVYEEMAASYATLTESQAQIDSALPQVESGLSQIEDGIPQLEDGLEQLEMVLNLAQLGLDAAQSSMDLLDLSLSLDPENETLLNAKAQYQAQIDEYTAQISDLQTQYDEYSRQYDELLVQRDALNATYQELTAAQNQINSGYTQLEQGQKQAELEFAAAEAKLDENQLKIDQSRVELEEGQKALQSGIAEYNQGLSQYEDGLAQFEAGREEAMAELSDAQNQLMDGAAAIADGTAELADMSLTPGLYVLGRDTNVGYVCFESDAQIVADIAVIMPLFFFLVAALVCITTMTKMVEEERTQIGVLKALGYGTGAISFKYLAYSALASVLGCGLGIIIGTVVLPTILWHTYGILYSFTYPTVIVWDLGLSLGMTGCYLLVMCGVTWLCCKSLLRDVPATLIRPKAPKAGKRVLLEYLPFWNKLGFLTKVSARNVFRYKKRLFMMLLGIGGCTALLITGFGFNDSISEVINYQFEDVTHFDIQVSFDGEQSPDDQEVFRQYMGFSPDNILFVGGCAVDLQADAGVKSVTLVASDQPLDGYMDLHQGDRQIDFPGVGETVVSMGVAKTLGLSVGDRVSLRTSDMETLEVRISGIFDNYAFNYAIINQSTAQQQWGHTIAEDQAYLVLPEDADPSATGVQAGNYDGVISVTVNADTVSRLNSMLGSLDYVVAIIVGFAAALAFIVLYNLTNINISERLREIATIKVLGFTRQETASYVSRENLVLAAMGMLVGIPMGTWLLGFVIDMIKIDMICFDTRISLFSYGISLVLTMVFAMAINLFMSRKLEKINMAEALKAAE